MIPQDYLRMALRIAVLKGNGRFQKNVCSQNAFSNCDKIRFRKSETRFRISYRKLARLKPLEFVILKKVYILISVARNLKKRK